jgi:FAD/FMN-containing dehydrogenase
MSKIAQYLQEHLLGEVTASVDARKHFSTDNSIFTVTPSVVVYPRNEHDVRKTARFAWQLAERGRILPITARGTGTDYTGAAIGAGIVVAFPAHMNRIVQLDTKTGNVIVEPGLVYGRLQQTLHTHDRFVPAYPASLEYSTVGGAVANNASGEKSYKYGSTEDYVRGLRVVLSNGEVISTSRLTKRELGKKLGLTTFEGEIYRQLDRLIDENKQTITAMKRNITRNTAGYNLSDVKLPNGSFDLTPLFVGSQGTLGIVSEITLMTEPFNPETTVLMASFDSIDSGCEAVNELRKLPHQPCAIEMVDGHLLSFIERLNPNQLKGLTAQPVPAMVLFIEYDDLTERQRRKNVKRTSIVLDKLASEYRTATNHEDRIKLWKVRQASASLLSHSENQLKAIPIIDDAVVPPAKLAELLKGAYQLFGAAKLQIAAWGSAGDGLIHLHPFLDLSQLGDRQRAFKLYEDYYKLVLELGGSTSGQHNDGRLRGPLLPNVYGPEAYALFQKVKKIFDPMGILNPGVKIDVTMDQIKAELRTDYTLGHLHNHMPRS